MTIIRDSGAYLLCGRSREACEIRLPLPRQEGLLRRVAVLAGGHDVGPHGPAPADQRHDVIERETAHADVTLAVVAATLRDPPLPPPALSKLARPRLLAPDPGGVALGHEPPGRGHAPPVATARCPERPSHAFR